ncbi:hypothetical protein BH09ACT1_BH09ACT1_02800 [soil metagenome]
MPDPIEGREPVGEREPVELPESDVSAETVAEAEAVVEPEPAEPVLAEPVIQATEADFAVARAALLEMTSPESIAGPAGSIANGAGTVTVYFDTNLSGYPGWRWTVSLTHIDGGEATVLETELTPGDGALLSPAWIPWVDRLADYRAAQDALGEPVDDSDDSDDDDDADDADDDSDDDSDDDDSDDESEESDDDDDDDLGSDVLHSGDVDGVDIDEVELDSDDDDEIPEEDEVTDLDDHIADDTDLESAAK